MSASSLPPEVLSLIFSSLDPLSLHRVCTSSKQLRQIASLPALWCHHYEAFWPSSVRGSAGAEVRQCQAWRQRNWAEGLSSIVERQKACSRPEPSLDGGSESPLLSLDTLLSPLSESRSATPDLYEVFLARIQNDHRFFLALRGLIVDPRGLDSPSTTDNRPSPRRLASSCVLVLKYGQDIRDFLHKLVWDQTIDGSNVDKVMARFRQEQHSPWPNVYDIHLRLADGQGTRRPHRDYHLALQHYARSMLGYLQRAEGLGILRQVREHDLGSRALGSLSGASWGAKKTTKAVEEALAVLSCFRGGDPAEIFRYLDLLALSCYFSLGPWSSTSADSLQDIVRRIMAHLQHLGLAIADPLNFLDIDNSFLNISVMCPDNRATLPLTLTLIFCAVCRRLGIAAALCNTPGRIVAVVQDGPDHFYVDASKRDPVSGDLHNFAGEGQTVYNEAVRSVEWRPASPADLIRRCAHNVLNAAQNGRGMPRVIHVNSARSRRTREQQKEATTAGEEAEEGKSKPSTPAEDLLKFLSTHPKDQPAMLLQFGSSRAVVEKALLPLTYTALPASRRSSARQEDEEDATYAAAWIMAELSPEELGARGKEWIMSQIENNYRLDVLLCPGGQTELNKLTSAQRRSQRHRAPGAASDDVLSDEDSADTWVAYVASPARSEAPSASDSDSDDSEEVDDTDSDQIFRRHVRLLLQNDSLPPQPHTRTGATLPQDNDETSARPLDRPDPVEYSVGTLFKHRRYGYRGAIVGWDAQCAASASWIQQMGVDHLDGGGRDQPFYHVIVEDSSRRYVAQCNIVPALGPRQGHGRGQPRGPGSFPRVSPLVHGGGQSGIEGMNFEQGSEDGEGIEEFVEMLNVRGIGRHFRAADPERCRLRKTDELREAFPDDDSGGEERSDEE